LEFGKFEQVCDDNRLYNTITGFAPTPPTFPWAHKKNEDPEWEFKDSKGAYQKWTRTRIESVESRSKFLKELEIYMRDLNIVEPDVNYLYRLSSFKEWNNPKQVALEVRRRQTFI